MQVVLSEILSLVRMHPLDKLIRTHMAYSKAHISNYPSYVHVAVPETTPAHTCMEGVQQEG